MLSWSLRKSHELLFFFPAANVSFDIDFTFLCLCVYRRRAGGRGIRGLGSSQIFVTFSSSSFSTSSSGLQQLGMFQVLWLFCARPQGSANTLWDQRPKQQLPSSFFFFPKQQPTTVCCVYDYPLGRGRWHVSPLGQAKDTTIHSAFSSQSYFSLFPSLLFTYD